MPVAPHLSVIVPAYNEAKSIGRALAAMRSYLDRQPYASEVIVSADGNDGTRELVAEMARADARLSVIGSADRGGKGRGIRNGIARARGQVIGFADADYKTPIEELDKLLPYLGNGYDVVIGSRATPDAVVERAQPLYRRAGSKVFGAVVHTMLGLADVPDTQCGFKFFTRRAAVDIFARQQIDGYMFDIEILRLSKKLGYNLKSVGVRWKDDGDSRYDPIGGTWKNFRELARIRFMRYADLGTPATFEGRGAVPGDVERKPADSNPPVSKRPPIEGRPSSTPADPDGPMSLTLTLPRSSARHDDRAVEAVK